MAGPSKTVEREVKLAAHATFVLPDLTDGTLDRLEVGFDRPIANPSRTG